MQYYQSSVQTWGRCAGDFFSGTAVCYFSISYPILSTYQRHSITSKQFRQSFKPPSQKINSRQRSTSNCPPSQKFSLTLRVNLNFLGKKAVQNGTYNGTNRPKNGTYNGTNRPKNAPITVQKGTLCTNNISKKQYLLDFKAVFT